MTRAEKLQRIETLMASPDVIELENLAAEVDSFEREVYPIPPPTVAEAMKFRREQMQESQREISLRAGMSLNRWKHLESGKNEPSLPDARKLYAIGIPASVLLGQNETMKKLKLPDGTEYGTGADGRRIIRGAMMGRCSRLPDDLDAPCKLRLVKLTINSGGYDEGGAYWGRASDGTRVYWAHRAPSAGLSEINVFAWSPSRTEARDLVTIILPYARFYN